MRINTIINLLWYIAPILIKTMLFLFFRSFYLMLYLYLVSLILKNYPPTEDSYVFYNYFHYYLTFITKKYWDCYFDICNFLLFNTMSIITLKLVYVEFLEQPYPKVFDLINDFVRFWLWVSIPYGIISYKAWLDIWEFWDDFFDTKHKE